MCHTPKPDDDADGLDVLNESGPGVRRYPPGDVDARLTIENSKATAREKKALLKIVADRRAEINAMIKRAERAEKLLRSYALEDAAVQLYASGAKVLDIAAKLGVTSAFVSSRVGYRRKQYARLFGTDVPPVVRKYEQVRTQTRQIAAGEDPFAEAVGNRGRSLITRLSEPDPASEEPTEVQPDAEGGVDALVLDLAELDRYIREEEERNRQSNRD